MNRRSLGLVSLLAVTCLLALNASAGAQATSTTTSTTTPLTGTIGSPCHSVTVHTTMNPQGQSNFVSHINVHGEGIGQTTGTKYEFNQASAAGLSSSRSWTAFV